MYKFFLFFIFSPVLLLTQTLYNPQDLYDDYGAGGMVTGRTCHLCNGQGCARCNQTGRLD